MTSSARTPLTDYFLQYAHIFALFQDLLTSFDLNGNISSAVNSSAGQRESIYQIDGASMLTSGRQNNADNK
ncbi:putative cellulose synthase A catalytic subunit 10 [Trichinella pseudospiralis]